MGVFASEPPEEYPRNCAQIAKCEWSVVWHREDEVGDACCCERVGSREFFAAQLAASARDPYADDAIAGAMQADQITMVAWDRHKSKGKGQNKGTGNGSSSPDEGKKRLAEVKSGPSCRACGARRQWAGDDACPKNTDELSGGKTWIYHCHSEVVRKSTTQSSFPSDLVLLVQIIDIWSDLSGGAWFVLGTVDLYAGRWNGAEELAKQTRMFLELLQTLFQELSPENENVRLVAAANTTTNKATTCEHVAEGAPKCEEHTVGRRQLRHPQSSTARPKKASDSAWSQKVEDLFKNAHPNLGHTALALTIAADLIFNGRLCTLLAQLMGGGTRFRDQRGQKQHIGSVEKVTLQSHTHTMRTQTQHVS